MLQGIYISLPPPRLAEHAKAARDRGSLARDQHLEAAPRALLTVTGVVTVASVGEAACAAEAERPHPRAEGMAEAGVHPQGTIVIPCTPTARRRGAEMTGRWGWTRLASWPGSGDRTIVKLSTQLE